MNLKKKILRGELNLRFNKIMNSLNTRIYTEISDWKYNIIFLSKYLSHVKKIRKFTNIILISFSILSIGGLLQFAKFSLVWFVILSLVQLIRIFINQIFVSEDVIIDIHKALDFYLFNFLDIEKLFFDFHSGRYEQKIIENRYNKFREKERDLIMRQKFNLLPKNHKLIKESELEADNYLNNLKYKLQNQ